MIYLTGASGFLGGAIYDQLKNTQECICLSRNKNLNNSDYIFCDLNSDNPTFPTVNSESVLVHCASMIKGPKKELFQTNVNGTKKLIDWAKKEKINKIIYISSLDVETSNTNYANSKKEAEDYIKESKLDYCIIRPAVIFGENDTKNIAQLITVIQKCPILFIPNKGTFIWQPVSVLDCVDLVIAGMSLTSYKNEVLSLVGPQQFTFFELVRLLKQKLKTRLIVINLPYWITSVIHWIGFIVGKKQWVSQFMSSFQTKLPKKKSVIKIGRIKLTDLFS